MKAAGPDHRQSSRSPAAQRAFPAPTQVHSGAPQARRDFFEVFAKGSLTGAGSTAYKAFIDDGGGAEPLQTERTASGSGEKSPTGWFSRLQRRYHLSFVDGFGLHLEGSQSFALLAGPSLRP